MPVMNEQCVGNQHTGNVNNWNIKYTGSMVMILHKKLFSLLQC